MKTSRKLLATLLALGLAAAAPAVHAATGAKPAKKERPAQRVSKAVDARDKELTEKLDLTAEQQAKLAELRKTGAEQLKSAAGDRAKMREVVQAQHDDVRAMLTPEQQVKFDAMPATGRAGKAKKAK